LSEKTVRFSDNTPKPAKAGIRVCKSPDIYAKTVDVGDTDSNLKIFKNTALEFNILIG